MIEIMKCSEYNVRAMKQPDFKEKVPGFNFSYPVMNTIDICNILMNGGSIEISMNDRSKSVWLFETETSTLKITGNGIEEKHTIINTAELGKEMLNFFEKIKKKL